MTAASLAVIACAAAPVQAQTQAQSGGQTPQAAQPQQPTQSQWPDQPKPAKGAPNVLLIMTDDVGFGASSTFGGPVPTAAFDALAQAGVKYNRFHTSALCSPTRASLLTGRNPHAVGMGVVTNFATIHPGYNSVIPKSAATVAEVLRENGYGTAMFGKGHITPEWEQGPSGPFDRWPTGLGFEYYYGVLNADASQFEPAMVRNTTPVDPGTGRDDYFMETDMANDAIGWVDRQKETAPDKPFFMYYAPVTAHTPHHAPKEWLEKFRGKFDAGWDKMREETFRRQKKAGVIPADAVLTPRPANVPAWDSIDPVRQRLFARHMEAYAAALSFADHEVGRIIDHLKERGEFENTLIIYIQGDNGSSAEGRLDGVLYEQVTIGRLEESLDYKLANMDKIGGRELYNHFPAPWAWALNTPFQLYKQVASHLGGIRNGMVMSWPKVIPAGGGLRSQFHHVSDIAPTILSAAGITPPAVVNGVAQQPLDGVAMNYSFTDPKAPSQKRRQVFEMLQNFGIYEDGWFASSAPQRAPWELYKETPDAVTGRKWELYNIEKDYSQSVNLAAKEPERLKRMQALFMEEAAKGKILPIHNTALGVGQEEIPYLSKGRTNFEYRSRIRRVHQNTAPPVLNRSFSIAAEVTVPKDGAAGAIVAHGGRFSGYSLALVDGAPVFTYNAVPPHISEVASPEKLAPGKHTITVDITYDGGGAGKGAQAVMSVDGAKWRKAGLIAR